MLLKGYKNIMQEQISPLNHLNLGRLYIPKFYLIKNLLGCENGRLRGIKVGKLSIAYCEDSPKAMAKSFFKGHRILRDPAESGEASHSGLVHRLGKAAYRKVSRVRISPPPQF